MLISGDALYLDRAADSHYRRGLSMSSGQARRR
jgi:hypothetical protein